MSNQSESIQSVQKSWKPPSIWAWLLTVMAGLLALIAAVLAYCMMFPVRFDGLGAIGVFALLYPLHLLLFTAVAAVMAYMALRSRARLAAWVFGSCRS